MVVLSELIVRSLTKPLTCKRSEVFSVNLSRHGLQISAIGFDAASVFVPHPMQNRTTAELHAFADQAWIASCLLSLSECHRAANTEQRHVSRGLKRGSLEVRSGSS
jgi:hypothetical protein